LSKLLRNARLGSKRRDIVDFTSSTKADQRLLENVVTINKAHVIMMAERGIVKRDKAAALLEALEKIKLDTDITKTDVEDVHMYVEESVLESAGPEIGGDLHIGKSRNDQVSTAIRMTLRESLIQLMLALTDVQEKLLTTAEKHVETLFPGYTHTQPAQPITFAHYLLSFFDAFSRDLERLMESYQRVNKSPMGGGALAGTSFPIDRERTAQLLGFSGIIENSLDAVGSRDFIVETQAGLSLVALNLSRFVEDLILWTSAGFGLVELADEFSSTSSIMPQKKNPEVPEVIRARMSDVAGNLLATIMTLKSLPSGYNMDFQEITPKLWESIDLLSVSLPVLRDLIATLKVSDPIPSRLLDLTTSTELANMLVRRHGLPFRSAHRIVGALVRDLAEKKLSLSDVTPDVIKSISTRIIGFSVAVSQEDIRACLDPKRFVDSHKVKGGPSPMEVTRMLKSRDQYLARWREKLSKEADRQQETREALRSIEETYRASRGHGLP